MSADLRLAADLTAKDDENSTLRARVADLRERWGELRKRVEMLDSDTIVIEDIATGYECARGDVVAIIDDIEGRG